MLNWQQKAQPARHVCDYRSNQQTESVHQQTMPGKDSLVGLCPSLKTE